MRKFAAVLCIACFLAAGCETMDKTEKGAAIGGLVGATAGGIVGHQQDKGWQGALIGGAAGALAGGAIGHQMDKRQQAVNPNHLTLVQIVDMAKSGAPDDVIISEIVRTKSKYELTSEMIDYLKNNGVGSKVVDYILSQK